MQFSVVLPLSLWELNWHDSLTLYFILQLETFNRPQDVYLDEQGRRTVEAQGRVRVGHDGAAKHLQVGNEKTRLSK